MLNPQVWWTTPGGLVPMQTVAQEQAQFMSSPDIKVEGANPLAFHNYYNHQNRDQMALPQRTSPTGGGDKMVVVEDSKEQLRNQVATTTQLIQGANGQMIQVQVPANNNNNNNNNNTTTKQQTTAGGQVVVTSEQQQHQQVVEESSVVTSQHQQQQVVTQVVTQSSTTAPTASTTTDHSIHRCPLCPYVTTSVNDFCKHVVLHAEARSDPEPAQEPASVTIQPAVTQVTSAADKPQITIVASSGNAPGQTITQFTTNGQPQQPQPTTQYRCGVCGELFTDNGVLQNHLRSHQETTTRLFSCSLCGVVYANRQQLETHMQTHMSQQAAAPTGTVTLQTAAAVAAAAAAQQTTNVGGGQPAQAAAAAGGQVAGGGQAAALNGETRQVLIQTAGGGWIMKQEPSTTGAPLTGGLPTLPNSLSGSLPAGVTVGPVPVGPVAVGASASGQVSVGGDAMSPSKPKERPYPCATCGKTFCQKAHLENHLRIHTGERPFACSMCGKAFRRKEHIGRHMRIHTGERPFCCTHCGKRFSQKVHLESHIRIHTGERPFSCSACGKTFTRKEHIERHIKTHTGERMFVCSQCGKSFNQKAHLESHMRTHTGERPYTCGSCGKTFRQRVQLERHARTHVATGTEGILTTAGGQQVLTVAAVPGQQVAFVADPNLIQQLQSADGHTTITIPACTLCGKAFCNHMDAQQKQLIAAAAAQGATVQVLTAPGQHLVQEGGQLQVVEAAVVGGVAGVGAIGAIAEGTQDAVAQAVAQATGLEQHEVSVQGMSVQEQVDKAISNAVA